MIDYTEVNVEEIVRTFPDLLVIIAPRERYRGAYRSYITRKTTDPRRQHTGSSFCFLAEVDRQ